MPTLYQAIEVNHCFKGTALSFEGKKISYSTFIDNVDILLLNFMHMELGKIRS